MQSIFSNALSRAVAKHIGLSATRRETLSWLALLIMQHGTISLWRLAAYVASAAQIASVRRRFYRFFQFVDIDGALAARVVVDLLRLSGKPWVLAIDRTNWDFGKTTINILMISVAWNGASIPLIWMLLPSAGNSNLGAHRASGSPAHDVSRHEDRSAHGRSRIHRRCVDGLSLSCENPLHPASAREPVRPARGLRRSADFPHRTAFKSSRTNDRQRPLLARLPKRDFVLVRAAGGAAARVRGAVGLGLFRPSTSRTRRISAKMDDRIHVRQSQDQRLRAGSHSPDRPGQTMHLARAAGFRRSTHCQNRCRHGASASHSRQKTWSPCLVAVRSRPQHAPQNLRRRKSKSNNRLPRTTPIAKTTHQTLALLGFPIASRVLWS